MQWADMLDSASDAPEDASVGFGEVVAKANVDQNAQDVVVAMVKSGKKSKKKKPLREEPQGKKATGNKTSNEKVSSNNKEFNNEAASNKKGNSNSSKKKFTSNKDDKGTIGGDKGSNKGKSGTNTGKNKDSDFPSKEEHNTTGSLLSKFIPQTEHSPPIDSVQGNCATMFFDGKKTGDGIPKGNTPHGRIPNDNPGDDVKKVAQMIETVNRDYTNGPSSDTVSKVDSCSNPGKGGVSKADTGRNIPPKVVRSEKSGTPSDTNKVVSGSALLKDKGKASLKQTSPQQTQQSKQDANSTQLNDESKATSNETVGDTSALKAKTSAPKAETDVAKTETNGRKKPDNGQNTKNSKGKLSSPSSPKSRFENFVGANTSAPVGKTRFENREKTRGRAAHALAKKRGEEKEVSGAVPPAFGVTSRVVSQTPPVELKSREVRDKIPNGVKLSAVAVEKCTATSTVYQSKTKTGHEKCTAASTSYQSKTKTGHEKCTAASTSYQSKTITRPAGQDRPSQNEVITGNHRQTEIRLERSGLKHRKTGGRNHAGNGPHGVQSPILNRNDGFQEGYKWAKNNSAPMGKKKEEKRAHPPNRQGNGAHEGENSYFQWNNNSYHGNNEGNSCYNQQGNKKSYSHANKSYWGHINQTDSISYEQANIYNQQNEQSWNWQGNKNGQDNKENPKVCRTTMYSDGDGVLSNLHGTLSCLANGIKNVFSSSSDKDNENADGNFGNIVSSSMSSNNDGGDSCINFSIDYNTGYSGNNGYRGGDYCSDYCNGNSGYYNSGDCCNGNNVYPHMVSNDCLASSPSNTNDFGSFYNQDLGALGSSADLLVSLHSSIQSGSEGLAASNTQNPCISVPNINRNAANINTLPYGLSAMQNGIPDNVSNNGLNTMLNIANFPVLGNLSFLAGISDNLPLLGGVSSGMNGRVGTGINAAVGNAVNDLLNALAQGNGIKGGNDMNKLLNLNVLNALAQVVNGNENVANGFGNGTNVNLSSIDLAAMINGHQMMKGNETAIDLAAIINGHQMMKGNETVIAGSQNANSANDGQVNANSASNGQVNATSANNDDQDGNPVVKSAKAENRSKAQQKSMNAHAVEGKVNLAQAVEGKPPNSTHANLLNSTHSVDGKVNAKGKADGEVVPSTEKADIQAKDRPESKTDVDAENQTECRTDVEAQKEAQFQVQAEMQGSNKQAQPKFQAEEAKTPPSGKDEKAETRPLCIANGKKKLQSKNISKRAHPTEPESKTIPQKPAEEAGAQLSKAENNKAGDKPFEKPVDKPAGKIANAGIAKPVEVAKPASEPAVLDDERAVKAQVAKPADTVEVPEPVENPAVLDEKTVVLHDKPGEKPEVQVQDDKRVDNADDKPGVLDGKSPLMDTEGLAPVKKGKKKRSNESVQHEEPALTRNGFDLLQTSNSLLQTHFSQVDGCQIDGSRGTLNKGNDEETPTKGNDGEALDKGNGGECNEERSPCKTAELEGGIHNQCEDGWNKCERNDWEGRMLTGCTHRWEEGWKTRECKESRKAYGQDKWEGFKQGVTEANGFPAVPEKNGFPAVTDKNGSPTVGCPSIGEETLGTSKGEKIPTIAGKGLGIETKSSGQATVLDVNASEFTPSMTISGKNVAEFIPAMRNSGGASAEFVPRFVNGKAVVAGTGVVAGLNQNPNWYESIWTYSDGNCIYNNHGNCIYNNQGENKYSEGAWIYNEGENQKYSGQCDDGNWTYTNEKEAINGTYSDQGDWSYNYQGDWGYNGQYPPEHYLEEYPVALNNSSTLLEQIVELLKSNQLEKVVGEQTDRNAAEDDHKSRNLASCSVDGLESSRLNHHLEEESSLHIPGLDEAVASARLCGSKDRGMERYFASLKLRD